MRASCLVPLLAVFSVIAGCNAGSDDDDTTPTAEPTGTPESSPTPSSPTPPASPAPPPSPTPTPTPTPTPVPVSLIDSDVLVRSATEVSVTVRVDQPVAVTLRYGQTTLDQGISGQAAGEQYFFLYGLEPGATYSYQIVSRGDVLTSGDFQLETPPAGPFKVMFDAAHGQTEGNADWIIDNDAPAPSPTTPKVESDWKGGYSAWGFDLWRTGRYNLTINKKKLTYGSSSGDLASMDALIVPEPNTTFTASEVDAIGEFVQNGGGLFIIANHAGSDRNGDGWDAVEIWDYILEGLSPTTGIYIDAADWSEDEADTLFSSSSDPVLAGPFGRVQQLEFNRSTTFHIDPARNPGLQGLVWTFKGDPGDDDLLLALRGYYGQGRIVVIGDSAPADDGTGQSGDELYDSWGDALHQNAAFFLNGTAWLVEDLEGFPASSLD